MADQQTNLPILAGLRDVADSHATATSNLNANITGGLKNVVGSIANLRDSFLNLSNRQMSNLEYQILKQEKYFIESLEHQKSAASGPLQIMQTLFGFISQNQATKIARLEDQRNKQEANFKGLLGDTIEVSKTVSGILEQQTEVFEELKDNFAKMIALSGQQTVMMAKQRQDYITQQMTPEKFSKWREMVGDIKERYRTTGEGISQKEKIILKGDRLLSGMSSLQKVIWDVKDLLGQPVTKKRVGGEKETAAKLASEAQNTAAVNRNTDAVKAGADKEEETNRTQRKIFGKNGTLHKGLEKFVKEMSQGSSGLGTWLLGFGKSMLRWMPMLAAFGSSAIDYFGAQGAKESRKQHWLAQGYTEEEANRLGQAGTEGYGSSFGTLAGAGIGMLFGGPFGAAIGAVLGNYVGKWLTGPDSIGERLEKFVIDWGKSNDKILSKEEELLEHQTIQKEKELGWWDSLLRSLGFGPALDQIDENQRRAAEAAQRRRDAIAAEQAARQARDEKILNDKSEAGEQYRQALEILSKNPNPEALKSINEWYANKTNPGSVELKKSKDGALLNEKGNVGNQPIIVPVPVGDKSSGTTINNVTNNTTKVSMATDPEFKRKVMPDWNAYGRPAYG